MTTEQKYERVCEEYGEVYLVSYAEQIPKKFQSTADGIFREIPDSPIALPLEAGPFSAREARSIAAKTFGGLDDRVLWSRFAFDWQPPVTAIRRLGADEALVSVMQCERADLTEQGRIGLPLDGNRDWCTQVQGYALPRCWAFLLFGGPFIPPGIGYLMDRYRRSVFSRRYIDLSFALDKLGFQTPRSSNRQLADADARMRETHDWVEYAQGSTVVCEFCGKDAIVGSHCCGEMVRLGDWVRRKR